MADGEIEEKVDLKPSLAKTHPEVSRRVIVTLLCGTGSWNVLVLPYRERTLHHLNRCGAAGRRWAALEVGGK